MNYKNQFNCQRRMAEDRSIHWQLTYEQWLEIWTSSGHLDERGRKQGQYCMSRFGDTGPYSVDNVFIQRHEQNSRDAHIGKKHTEEHRQKIGASHKGKIRSEQSRQNISAACKGRPAPNKGIKHTEETRQKISAAQKGKPARNKGLPHSEETRLKISASLKGKSRGPHSEERRQKMIEAWKLRKLKENDNGISRHT